MAFGASLLATGSLGGSVALAAPPARDAGGAGSGAGSASADGDAEDIEGVETIETVTPVEPAGAGHRHQENGFWAVAGKLHPLLVHFPIAYVLLLLLVELVGWRNQAVGWQRAGAWLGLMTVIAVVPAVVTGLLRASSLTGQPDPDVVLHRNLMLGVTAAVGLAALLRLWRGDQRFSGGWRGIYLLLLLAAAALVTVGGHVGGEIVYGHDYLPF